MRTKYKIFTGLAAIFFIIITVNGQIAIGKQNVEGNSTLLDFDDSPSNTRGIILPSVLTLPATPANGTFVFDTTDSKVKVYYIDSENTATWHDLSGAGNSLQININHLTNTDEIGNGTIMGETTPNVEGVLVLESPNKAMILPKISSPHINVKSPYPGMICYDTATRSLAVFDGLHWNFWR